MERVVFIKALRMVVITVILAILAMGCSSQSNNAPAIEISINKYIELFNMGINSVEGVASSLIDESTKEETDIETGEFAGLKKISYTNGENMIFNFYADDTDANINKIEIVYDGNIQPKDNLTLFYAYTYFSVYIIENYETLLNGEEPTNEVVDNIYNGLNEESGEYISGEKAKYSLSWGDGSEMFIFTFSILPLE